MLNRRSFTSAILSVSVVAAACPSKTLANPNWRIWVRTDVTYPTIKDLICQVPDARLHPRPLSMTTVLWGCMNGVFGPYIYKSKTDGKFQHEHVPSADILIVNAGSTGRLLRPLLQAVEDGKFKYISWVVSNDTRELCGSKLLANGIVSQCTERFAC